MGLREVDKAILEELVASVVADKKGRPDESKQHLVAIQAKIQEFLGGTNAVDEELEAKEETPQTPGHCQPDQAHEESS